MYVIVLLITLSSCINSYNFDKKEKMEEAIGTVTSKVLDNPEVEGTINSIVRFAFRPVRLLIDLANAEIDEKFLNRLEKKIESEKEKGREKQEKEKAKARELMMYVKNKDMGKLEGLLQEEEEVDWKNRLINLNEEITLNNGSRTTYANFIVGKGCYNKEILKIIVKNFPKKDKGFYSIHMACILGSEDFVDELIEEDKERGCLNYYSGERNIQMNSLAYASMLNHQNLVRKLLDLGVRSHEGYILSVILGNQEVEKLYMKKVYVGEASISELKEVVRNMGRGNNIFHMLPLIKCLKKAVSKAVSMERNSNSKILDFMKDMKEKKEGMLLGNLVDRLKRVEFTEEEVIGLLKAKNEQGKTPIEYLILSKDEELYKALSDAVVVDKQGGLIGGLKLDLELFKATLLSGVEAGHSRAVKEILEIKKDDKANEIVEVVRSALDRAIDFARNEVVFLLCKYLVEEGRLDVVEELVKKNRENNCFLFPLLNKLKSSVHMDISYKAVDLRDIGNMSLEAKEGDYNRNVFHYAVMFGNEALVSSIINRIESLDRRDCLELLNRKDGEGKTVFHLCFESNCSNILRRLWDCGVKSGDKGDSIKQVDGKGNTPLHYTRSVEILRESERLLGDKFREVCNCKNEAGRNVLMQYISDLTKLRDNSKEVINFLLKNYDYGYRDEEGKSLEMLMIEKDEDLFHDYLKDIFKKKGFDKKQKDRSENNLLHYVAKYSKEGKCISLFDNKSYCDLGGEKNKDGLKARYIAVEEDNSKVLQLMLERYREIKGEKKFEEKANKMMIEAVNNKKNAVIAMLLDMGIEETRKGMRRSVSTESLFEDKKVEIDYIGIMEEGLKLGSRIVMEKVFEYEDKFPSDMDESIKKIIEEKIEENSTEAAGYIIDRYVERSKLEDEKDKQIIFTILVRATKANKNNFFNSLMGNEIIKKEMISYKVDSDEVMLLHIASCLGRYVIAKLLIDKGAEIEAASGGEIRALMLSAFNGHKEVCDLLIEKGAEIEAAKEDGGRALMLAAYNGHIEVCELLLDRGAEIEAADKNGKRTLMLAAQEGHKEVCELLIDKGAEIEAADKNGKRTLMLAAQEGHKEVCKLLIENRAKIEVSDKDGKRTLMLAAQEGHKEVCGLLIEKGAEIEASDKDGWTALMYAAMSGCKEVCELMIEKGAKIEAANKNGWTALMYAAMSGCKEVCELLIEEGAEIEASDSNGVRTLMIAAVKGQKEVCELLIEKEAEIEAANINGLRALMPAAGTGHIEVCKLLIEKGAEIEASDSNGVRTLMIAAVKGQKEVCELLIEKEAEIEAANINGLRALMIAAFNGHKEVCNLLIEAGAEIEAAMEYGFRALMLAAHEGHKEVCKLLIEVGAEIEVASEDGERALMLAAQEGHKEVCKLLIEVGAEIEVASEDGERALMLAAQEGHKEVCGLLIDKGANVNLRNNWQNIPLHSTAQRGHLDICKLLIEKGSDTNAKDNDGDTPLHCAAIGGFTEICGILVGKGASLDTENNNGDTPLEIGVKKGHLNVCRLLIEKGTNVTVMEGAKLLKLAIDNGYREICELLIEKGAEVNAEDENGDTPMFYAVSNGDKEICKLLIERGVEVNKKGSKGRAVLHIAAQNGKEEICEMLIEKGAELNAEDEDGDTPLFYAVANGNKEICRLLIERGSEVNEKGSKGRTVLHIAAQNGKEEICEMLIEKRADVTAEDEDGDTPLFYAPKNSEVYKILLEKEQNK